MNAMKFFFGCILILSSCGISILKTVNETSTVSEANDVSPVYPSFDSIAMDYDHDGDLDKVLWNTYHMGDSLFLYENIDGTFQLVLATKSFIQEGLYEVTEASDVAAASVKIHTYSSSMEEVADREMTLEYKPLKGTWWLTKTKLEETICDSMGNCETQTCEAIQNILLERYTDWEDFGFSPEYDCNSIQFKKDSR